MRLIYKKRKKNKMVNLNPSIKIISLNVNSLNMLLKTETIILDKKPRPNFRVPTRNSH